MDKHTPTPWQTTGDGLIWRGKPDENIAQVLARPYDGELNSANAAFIVRAVNSHQALVAALERMLGAYEADKEAGFSFGNDNAADQARAALRLAKA